MYFTAGWLKIVDGDWLQQPYALYTFAQGRFRTDFAAWMLQWLPLYVWPVFQYMALAFELLSPLLFLIKRLRGIAIVWGMGFHVMIALLMNELIYFSLQMMAFYVLFIDFDRIRHFADRSLRLPKKNRFWAPDPRF